MTHTDDVDATTDSRRHTAAIFDTVHVTVVIVESPDTAIPLAVRGGRGVERRSLLYRDDRSNPIRVLADARMKTTRILGTARER